MAVNIFLKQFKATNEVVVEYIRQCDETQLTTERLKGLLKILPDEEKVCVLGK